MDDRTEVLLRQYGWLISFRSVPTDEYVEFKAFITKFSDGYGSSWEEKNVYGRMDPIPTFNRVGRKISLSWKLPASSPEEGTENLKKCETLVSMLYPTYKEEKDGNAYIAGAPLIKLYFTQMAKGLGGENLYDLLGYINGEVPIVPNYDEGVFYQGKYSATPKLIDLSINFTVLHNFKLGWDLEKKLREPKYNRYGYGPPITAEKKVDEEVRSEGSDTKKSDTQTEVADHTMSSSTRDGMVGKS